MSETEIRNAIWEMLCNYDKEQIKEAFELVSLDSLIDEVSEEFENETN